MWEFENDETVETEDEYGNGEFYEDVASDLMDMIKFTLKYDTEIASDLLKVFNDHFGY